MNGDCALPHHVQGQSNASFEVEGIARLNLTRGMLEVRHTETGRRCAWCVVQ